MSDNRKRDIFYGVVAVATLIVALIGATLAYFSISATSGEGAVNATAARVTIQYKDGQNVIAQGTELIPASLSVVKAVYEHNIEEINAQEDPEYALERTNKCLDSNGREVCSVYRFSVAAEITKSSTVTLRSEDNQFEYLAYAVRDVTNNTWLVLNPSTSAQSKSIAKCDNNDDNDANKCYTTNAGIKTYNNIALNSVYGYKSNGSFEEKNLTETEHVYDVLIFILENNAPQDVDQGKEFRGTIIVDIIDGAGEVTGEANY